MLESYLMVIRNELLFFPEEMKERFLETGPLPLRDGTQVSAEEIWEFMNVEGPARFPYAFTANPDAPLRMPYKVDLLSSIKLFYLLFSRRLRVESLRQQGLPLVYVQGGQTMDPYFAAQSVPLRPGDLTQLAAFYVAEGMNARDRDWKVMDIHEAGNRVVSMESCHQLVSHSGIRSGLIPVALMAPFTRVRCSDVTFLVESHRDGPMKTPSLLVDYPVNYAPHKTWMVDYVATGLRQLVSKIDELTGRTTSVEDFRAQIRLNNRIRRLAREAFTLWRSADAPPAGSVFVIRMAALGKDCDGDPVAAEHLLSLMRDEIEERVSRGLKGSEMARRPARIFKCGSCFMPNFHKWDKAGGALIGGDDWWSDVWMPDVEEEGDPYLSFARASLSTPYDLPTEQRAAWVVDQIKESRAEGLIFGYQWGCNFQSAVARLVCDMVQKETDIPSITLGTDELARGESLEQTDNRIEAFVEMLSF